MNGTNYERLIIANQIGIGLNEVSGIVASQGDSVIALQSIAGETIAKTSATQYIVSAEYVITTQTNTITVLEFIAGYAPGQVGVTFSSTQSYGFATVAVYVKNDSTQFYQKITNINSFNSGTTTIGVSYIAAGQDTIIFLESVDDVVPFDFASPVALSAEIFVL